MQLDVDALRRAVQAVVMNSTIELHIAKPERTIYHTLHWDDGVIEVIEHDENIGILISMQADTKAKRDALRAVLDEIERQEQDA